nr:MAG TPA: hypothetical protein [Caudoviricetes sp.]
MYYCESFQSCVSLRCFDDANILIYFQQSRVLLNLFQYKTLFNYYSRLHIIIL